MSHFVPPNSSQPYQLDIPPDVPMYVKAGLPSQKVEEAAEPIVATVGMMGVIQCPLYASGGLYHVLAYSVELAPGKSRSKTNVIRFYPRWLVYNRTPLPLAVVPRYAVPSPLHGSGRKGFTHAIEVPAGSPAVAGPAPPPTAIYTASKGGDNTLMMRFSDSESQQYSPSWSLETLGDVYVRMPSSFAPATSALVSEQPLSSYSNCSHAAPYQSLLDTTQRPMADMSSSPTQDIRLAGESTCAAGSVEHIDTLLVTMQQCGPAIEVIVKEPPNRTVPYVVQNRSPFTIQVKQEQSTRPSTGILPFTDCPLTLDPSCPTTVIVRIVESPGDGFTLDLNKAKPNHTMKASVGGHDSLHYLLWAATSGARVITLSTDKAVRRFLVANTGALSTFSLAVGLDTLSLSCIAEAKAGSGVCTEVANLTVSSIAAGLSVDHANDSAFWLKVPHALSLLAGISVAGLGSDIHTLLLLYLCGDVCVKMPPLRRSAICNLTMLLLPTPTRLWSYSHTAKTKRWANILLPVPHGMPLSSRWMCAGCLPSHPRSTSNTLQSGLPQLM